MAEHLALAGSWASQGILFTQDSSVCGSARGMLKMENFHKMRRFAHAVIDQNRGMHQLAHSGSPLNRSADVRKSFEQLDVIEYGVAKPLGAGGKGGPGVGEYALEVR
jgi:hypothetical protein